MNLANRLTLLRLALVPVFMIFTILDHFWTRFFALWIFITASLTDLIDGYVARKYGEITEFGKLMDPLADKFLISAAFISFVGMRELQVPSWMVVLIIGRELIVTGLRLLAAAKGEVLSADMSGKLKTSVQLTAVTTIMVILCVNSFLRHFYHLNPRELLRHSGWEYGAGILLFRAPFWLVFASMLITLYSGTQVLYKNRGIYAKEIGL